MKLLLVAMLVVFASTISTAWEYRGTISNACDCQYFSGGCRITRALTCPFLGCNYACRCYYRGFWTCSGKAVWCNDALVGSCGHPGTSYEHCVLGGGDCGGY